MFFEVDRLRRSTNESCQADSYFNLHHGKYLWISQRFIIVLALLKSRVYYFIVDLVWQRDDIYLS